MSSSLFLLDEWIKHPLIQAQLEKSTLVPAFIHGKLYRMPSGSIIIGTNEGGKISGNLLAAPTPRIMSILQVVLLTGEIHASQTTITAHVKNLPISALTWACSAPENHGGILLDALNKWRKPRTL